MLWALLNDIGQRILTLNKREQRANAVRVLRQIGRSSGASVLDFGCGTGLFATALASDTGRYVGFDIDERLVRYAGRLYGPLVFTHDPETVRAAGPYDCVIANCCFHHISDEQLQGVIGFIQANLRVDGHFVLIDLLAPDEPRPFRRHVYELLERGEFVRTNADHLRVLGGAFEVMSVEFSRAHLFSAGLSPLFSPLGTYVCRPRRGGHLGDNGGHSE